MIGQKKTFFDKWYRKICSKRRIKTQLNLEPANYEHAFLCMHQLINHKSIYEIIQLTFVIKKKKRKQQQKTVVKEN